MENQNTANQATENKEPASVLTVYQKDSKYKDENGNIKHWYSATLSDGRSCNVVFRCEVPTKSKAFQIFNVVGQAKNKTVEKDGQTYNNVTYYVSTCEFQEIKGEPLPL